MDVGVDLEVDVVVEVGAASDVGVGVGVGVAWKSRARMGSIVSTSMGSSQKRDAARNTPSRSSADELELTTGTGTGFVHSKQLQHT